MVLFDLASKFRKVGEAKVRAFYSLSFSFAYYTSSGSLLFSKIERRGYFTWSQKQKVFFT